jgi:hypothetical protein
MNRERVLRKNDIKRLSHFGNSDEFHAVDRVDFG